MDEYCKSTPWHNLWMLGHTVIKIIQESNNSLWSDKLKFDQRAPSDLSLSFPQK